MLHVALALALTAAPAPSEPEPAHPGRRLFIAGGITLGTGGASLISALGIMFPLSRAANGVFGASTPGETGFSPGRWSDWRGVQHRVDRLNIALRAFAITGAVLVVTGTTLLITGGVLKRQARRDHARVRLGPNLALRF